MKMIAQTTIETNILRHLKRGYIHAARAWYYDACFANRTDNVLDDVYFGLLSNEPGEDAHLDSEFIIQWVGYPFSQPTSHLSAFHDTWQHLAAVADVLAAMASLNGANLSPDQFCDILDELGFVDVTPTKPR